MARDGDFDDVLWDTLTLAKFSTQDTFGGPTYSTSATGAGTYQCYVTFDRQKVVAPDGQEIVSAMQVYIGQSTTGGDPPDVDVRDQLTLTGSVVPRILTVNRLGDEQAAAYVTVAYCG